MAEMILRDATQADVAALVEHGREFLAAIAPGYTLDMDGLPAALAALIAAPEGFVLAAERDGRLVGAFVGMICKPMMALERDAREIAWWIEPGARGSHKVFGMLSRFEAFAAAHGCKSCIIVTIPKFSPKGLRALLERRGYLLAEEAHVRAMA